MVDVLKEVAKFAVVKGPNIGHDCFKKKMAKVGFSSVTYLSR